MEYKNKTSKFELLSSREENRYFNLIEKIVEFIQDVKADEIYNAMKGSEFSKEYAVQRVKELFEGCMNNEKEMLIGQLEAEILEERELNKLLNDKNLDLDQEVSEMKTEFKRLKIENDKCKAEMSRLQEVYKNQTASLKPLEERLREYTIKVTEFDAIHSQRINEELNLSKSQTQKLKKELEVLQKDRKVAETKENEYKRDHQDLILHLQKLQVDKDCLESEIEQLSQVNFDLKSNLDSQISSTQFLSEQNRMLEETLRQEVDTCRSQTDQIILKFKEKSKKFKNKILEQKRKLEENSQFQYSATKSFENRLQDLESIIQAKNSKIAELEHLLEKTELTSSVKLETGKKQYEQILSQKLSEMQKEVQVQVKRCQDYERQIKIMTENKLKALESKNIDLETNKAELKGQLLSALQSLEHLRTAYTDQLALSEESRTQNSHLKRLLDDSQEELGKKLLLIQSLESSLFLEQQRRSETLEISKKLENNLKIVGDDHRKTLQELDQTLQIYRSLENNLENTLKENRNTQKEVLKNAEFAERLNSLEGYCQRLEQKVRVLKVFKKKVRNSGLKDKFSVLNSMFKGVKASCVSNFAALGKYTNELLEKIAYRVIEKIAENRKIKAEFAVVRKENMSLSQSVSVYSKEMDKICLEIADKQKDFKSSCKQIKYDLKQKFLEKFVCLEKTIKELKHENLKIRKEASDKLEKLQREVIYYRKSDCDKSELFKQTSNYLTEINFLETRIHELEEFLKSERSQKTHLVLLKNKEIEDLTNKLNLLIR